MGCKGSADKSRTFQSLTLKWAPDIRKRNISPAFYSVNCPLCGRERDDKVFQVTPQNILKLKHSIPALQILLKDGTKASHVPDSLHHPPPAPRERFSNIISHEVLDSLFQFVLFPLTKPANINRGNLMPDFERTPSSLRFFVDTQHLLQVLYSTEKNFFYPSISYVSFTSSLSYFFQFWKTILGIVLVVGWLREFFLLKNSRDWIWALQCSISFRRCSNQNHIILQFF